VGSSEPKVPMNKTVDISVLLSNRQAMISNLYALALPR
jgi:hypothetical protein